MSSSAQLFVPLVDASFIPGKVTEEVATPLQRKQVRTGWRIFCARDGFEVAIHEGVIERMSAFGERAEPNEWYALVVGRLLIDDAGIHVVISGVVFDVEAEATRGSIRTTPASELRTRELAALQYPESIPIGWAHGHVRCGPRYSSVDRENQRTWTQPHSVGIVVDPWDSELLGVYRGPNSERLTPISTFEASNSRPVPPTAQKDHEPSRQRTSGRRPVKRGLLSLTALAWLLLVAFVFIGSRSANERFAAIEAKLLKTEASMKAFENLGAASRSPLEPLFDSTTVSSAVKGALSHEVDALEPPKARPSDSGPPQRDERFNATMRAASGTRAPRAPRMHQQPEHSNIARPRPVPLAPAATTSPVFK